MTADYTGVWKFLFDWQTLIAGFFALIAGGMAYVAGVKQARVVEKQNIQLKQSERRQLARTSLIAARLLDGALMGIETDLTVVEDYIGSAVGICGGAEQYIDAAVVADSLKKIRKPTLELVWDQLGVLEPGSIESYLELDKKIETFWAVAGKNNRTRNSFLDEIRALKLIVGNLRDSLGQQSTGLIATLVQQEEPG
jgi:hypothetical protein